jgi:DNA (cytosine-5)-methyltransferase 1
MLPFIHTLKWDVPVVFLAAAAKMDRYRISPRRAMSPTFYEFFAGGGMARIGLGAHWKCLFANDVDAEKAASYKANHGDAALLVQDIRKVSIADLPGRADLAWASFPCQDLSLAGNRAGLVGERSGMFWPFWHLVRNLDKEGRAPKVVAIENVYGTLTANGGQDFATIASAFSGRGYRFGAIVVDAAAYVPQSRPRVFIIGVRRDIPIPASVRGFGPTALHPSAIIASQARMSKAALAKWVWWHLPQPPFRNTGLSSIIQDEPSGVTWNTKSETQYLLSLMNPLNRAKVERMKTLKCRVVGTIYRRTRPDSNGNKVQRAEVRFDDVAGCLRTPGGGSSRQTILIVEGASVRSRLLSPREAARLMGLPDDYVLPRRYNQAYHLIGDGVVAPIVRHLASEIIEPVLGAGVLRATA